MDEEKQLTVYGHPFCPQLPPTLGVLKQAKVPYNYIDIREDESARERVKQINNGYESVPTLIFPDGSTLTEPGTGELAQRLRAEGYRVPVTAYLTGNIALIITGIIVVIALIQFLTG